LAPREFKSPSRRFNVQSYYKNLFYHYSSLFTTLSGYYTPGTRGITGGLEMQQYFVIRKA
jgi:hypothetical protein